MKTMDAYVLLCLEGTKITIMLAGVCGLADAGFGSPRPSRAAGGSKCEMFLSDIF